MAHRYTNEQRQFIFDNYKGQSTQDLTDMFNAQFGTDLTPGKIKSFKGNHKLWSGVDCRFKPGEQHFTNGKGYKPTQFKKGQRSPNALPLGAERTNVDGYTVVKIQDGHKNKNWKFKHHIIWEKHNGPIPEGHGILFGDGNKQNFDISNLILVSRRQLAVLNQKRLLQKDAELTKTAIKIADLIIKTGERKKGNETKS